MQVSAFQQVNAVIIAEITDDIRCILFIAERLLSAVIVFPSVSASVDTGYKSRDRLDGPLDVLRHLLKYPQNQKEPGFRLLGLPDFLYQLQHCPEVRLDRVGDAPDLDAFRQWFI